MLATELPRPFHRHGWVYEEKVDGWRMLAERHLSRVTLTSRNGLDHTRRFPDLVKAIGDLGAESLVLDGEVAVFDRQLVSRFEWLRAQPKEDVATPPMYIVFDCWSWTATICAHVPCASVVLRQPLALT
jgi:bifunctional non-homologous end joining protein LigD